MKKDTVTFLAALLVGLLSAVTVGTIKNRTLNGKLDLLDKMGEFYRLLNRWLKLRQDGKTLVSYFKDNHYKTVAIYGMRELGERLYDELKDSEIKVKYAIDKDAAAIFSDVNIVCPDEPLPQVDVIVITAIHYYDEIEEKLMEKVDYPIVSIEDVVYQL